MLPEKVQEPYGCMEGGGLASETPGATSHTANRLLPHPPSLEGENGPQLANGRERGWLRGLPSITQGVVSGEELNQGKPGFADGLMAPSLSRLFACTFPNDDQYQGWLPESTRERSRIGGGGGTRSTCSGIVVGTDRNSSHSPPSLPQLLLGDRTAAAMKESTLVGITVRRPPSPQFYFMVDNCPDASMSSATSPLPRTPGDGQQPMQGTSCVNDVGAWMTDQEVRTPALSRKRRHPDTREFINPRDSHRSLSTGYDGASSTSENSACFGPRHRRGDRRKGSWGVKYGHEAPAVHNTTVGALRLHGEDASRGERSHMLRKYVEASGATEAERYQPATAVGSAPFETETSKRDTGGNDTPSAVVAGDGEASHAEGDEKRRGGDSRAATTYDQDALGGEGAAETSVGDFEPQTVAGVLEKLRCDETCTVIR